LALQSVHLNAGHLKDENEAIEEELLFLPKSKK